jgi:hypothetical protein
MASKCSMAALWIAPHAESSIEVAITSARIIA